MSNLTVQANILNTGETKQNILLVTLTLEEESLKFTSQVEIFDEKDEDDAYSVHLFLEDDEREVSLLERRVSLDNLPLIVGDIIKVEIYYGVEKKKKGKGVVVETHTDDDVKPGKTIDVSVLESIKD